MQGDVIHNECKKKYGSVLNINTHGWSYSDDTVMHYATAKALVTPHKNLDELMKHMAKEYIDCWDDMGGRAPGATCSYGCRMLQKMPWNALPYSKSGGGCGGSMRAMCIGLHFAGKENRNALVAVGIESGRLTHNHVNGFMGSLVSAAFTAFALEQIPIKMWGNLLMTDLMPRIEMYLQYTVRDWESEIKGDLQEFKQYFNDYLVLRNITNGQNDPVFPAKYGVVERDEQYKQWSYRGWGGASGHDSVVIAYDALLGCNGNYEELLNRAALHGGDSDSTGTIALAWYGAMSGFKQVPVIHYNQIEGKELLTGLANQLFALKDTTKIDYK